MLLQLGLLRLILLVRLGLLTVQLVLTRLNCMVTKDNDRVTVIED